MIEHLKHLRKINFILIALSTGAIILAIAAKEHWAEKALNELRGIKSFLQSQESSNYGKFGSLWLKRRLVSEYDQLKIDPKQVLQGAVHSADGKEVDCFGFYSGVFPGFPGCILDKTTLKSGNAALVEGVLSSSKPVETIAQWRKLWDGLYFSGRHIYWMKEVMFERAEILIVNHRPEYRRSAIGTQGFGSLVEVVKGARTQKNFVWVWGACERKLSMIKPKFIFFRPSANNVHEYTHALWCLLYDYPDDPNPRSISGKEWNNSAFYFLHIPIQVKTLDIDFQALIIKEAKATWQTGLFESSFPGLYRTLGGATNIPFDQAEMILSNFAELESRSSGSLRFGGFEIAGAPIFIVTLLVLLFIQLYFLIHLAYFFKGYEKIKNYDFPWIALYPSLLAKLIFLLTCISPTIAGLVIFFKFLNYNVACITIGSAFLSIATIHVFLKWSANWYNVLYKKFIK